MLIEDNAEEFERLAQGLLEYETLTGDEIKRVMAGNPPTEPEDDDKSDGGSAPSVTAIPKAKGKKSPPSGGMEPEPSV
jgi:cell division protease FtsH